jgi:hypothetical protein
MRIDPDGHVSKSASKTWLEIGKSGFTRTISMPWHKYVDEEVELTNPYPSAALSLDDEPAPSAVSPIVIALGVVIAVGGGALLSTLGTTGLDGVLNSAGLSRLTLADAQQQQGDAIASLDGKLGAITAEIAALKSRSNVLTRTSAGPTDSAAKVDADFATLRRGFASLTAETGYLDLRVEAVAKKAEAAADERVAALSADVAALKNEIAAVRVLHSEPARGPLVGRLDTFEAGLAAAEGDLSGLRSSFDGFAHTSHGEIVAITKRLDKIESAIGTDVTGSLPRASVRKRLVRPGISGWSLQDATEGHAVVSGRGGSFDVGEGTFVPGLGRVNAIRQQGNRWTVTTSRGPIVGVASPRD